MTACAQEGCTANPVAIVERFNGLTYEPVGHACSAHAWNLVPPRTWTARITFVDQPPSKEKKSDG